MPILLSLLLLLCWALTAQASTFFDTSFETCTTTGTSADFNCEGWRYLDPGVATNLGVSTEQAFSGTKSLKLTYVTLDNTHSITPTPSVYYSTNSTPPLPAGRHRFLRFATWVSPGFQIGPGATKRMRFKSDLNSYPILWVMLRGSTYQLCMEDPYDYAGTTECSDSGIAPNRGTWEQLEAEFQLNTPGQSNGLIRLWINGTLRVEKLNRAFVGPTTTSRNATNGLLNSSAYTIDSLQVYLQSGIGDTYYDRIAVGDTRIGPVSGESVSPLPPSDATSPSSPTSVTVH